MRFAMVADRQKHFVEGKHLFLFQVLPGHFGTRHGGAAFVQSVAAGPAAQVDVFDMQRCQREGRQPLFVQQR